MGAMLFIIHNGGMESRRHATWAAAGCTTVTEMIYCIYVKIT